MGIGAVIVMMFILCMVVYEVGRHQERERARSELNILVGMINKDKNKEKNKERDDDSH